MTLQVFSENDENGIAVKTLTDLEIKEKLEAYGKSLALQGELIGPGIQLNIYGLKKYAWKVSTLRYNTYGIR